MRSYKFFHILSLAVFFSIMVSVKAFARPPIDETFVPPTPSLIELIISYFGGDQ